MCKKPTSEVLIIALVLLHCLSRADCSRPSFDWRDSNSDENDRSMLSYLLDQRTVGDAVKEGKSLAQKLMKLQRTNNEKEKNQQIKSSTQTEPSINKAEAKTEQIFKEKSKSTYGRTNLSQMTELWTDYFKDYSEKVIKLVRMKNEDSKTNDEWMKLNEAMNQSRLGFEKSLQEFWDKMDPKKQQKNYGHRNPQYSTTETVTHPPNIRLSHHGFSQSYSIA